jgi:hypothetical protein
MTRLDLSDNVITDFDGDVSTDDSLSALLAVVRSSSTLLDLNIAKNGTTFRYELILPAAIAELHSLRTFTFDGGFANSEPVCMEADMTELDLCGKNLYSHGARLAVQFLPRCR